MLHVLYLIAITAEAMSATLAAGRREMDWVGVIIIAWVTALGGGTVRNVLFGHYPMSWVEHPEYLLITAGAAVVTGVLYLLFEQAGLSIYTMQLCLPAAADLPCDCSPFASAGRCRNLFITKTGISLSAPTGR